VLTLIVLPCLVIASRTAGSAKARHNVVIFPSVYKTIPFDMPGDFTPIAVVGATPIVLVNPAKVPAQDHKEFAALLKSKPGQFNYSTSVRSAPKPSTFRTKASVRCSPT
jgi:tripartite-type tricarboxylate transporter receptor subunit TctC